MIIANHSIYRKNSKQLNYLKTIYRILIFFFNLIKKCILCHLMDEVIAIINKRFESLKTVIDIFLVIWEFKYMTEGQIKS
jgi:hypothetical protein